VLKERIVLGRLVNRDSFSERAMALSQRGKFRYLDRMATSSRTMVQNSAKSNYHQLRHQLFTHSPQTRVQSDLRHMLVGSRTGRAKRAQWKGDWQSTSRRKDAVGHSQSCDSFSKQYRVPQPSTQLYQW